MTEWTVLHPIIDGGDPDNVVRLVRHLDAAARKTLAEPLRAYEKELRTASTRTCNSWS